MTPATFKTQKNLILSDFQKKTSTVSFQVHIYPSELAHEAVLVLFTVSTHEVSLRIIFSGSRFALLEMKVMAVHLLSKFEVVATDKTLVPLRLAKTFQPIPEGGFCVGLKKRKHTFISDNK